MAQHQEQMMNPGPLEQSLLYLQPRHISEAVWQRNADRILRTRRIKHGRRMIDPPPQTIEYLRASGFLGVARLGQFDYDRCLISALVERWRPETHTFHTTRGECTITLEDVAIQLGLPCTGDVVVGFTSWNWADLCQVYLGIRPPPETLHGQRLKMSWLEDNFNELPNDAADEQVQQFTRAYILRLIGGYLMPDRSGDRVYLMCLPFLRNLYEAGTYSWGSAVLSHLYRELCNATDPNEAEVGGCLSLLHMWAWDRFPDIAPTQPAYGDPDLQTYNVLPPLGFRWRSVRHSNSPGTATLHRYRSFFDKMVDDDIIWEPYQAGFVQQLIPEYCLQTPEIWRASVPLLYFHIVEWHHPDRVLRQFGREQPIPNPPMNMGNYHTLQLRGTTDRDWFSLHQNFVVAFLSWTNAVVNTRTRHARLGRSSEYMRWYWQHTRRWIHRSTCDTSSNADMADYLRRLSINTGGRCEDSDCRDFRRTVGHTSRNMLRNCREQPDDMRPQPAPPATELPRPQIPQQRPSRRRRAYLTTQPPAAEYNVSHEDQSNYMSPPYASHEQSNPGPSSYAQFQQFSSAYNTPFFHQGGPSDQSFVTPRHSVSLNESPWFFNNPSTSQINETSEQQEDDDDATQQLQRPRRNRTRARCGTGSHYL